MGAVMVPRKRDAPSREWTSVESHPVPPDKIGVRRKRGVRPVPRMGLSRGHSSSPSPRPPRARAVPRPNQGQHMPRCPGRVVGKNPFAAPGKFPLGAPTAAAVELKGVLEMPNASLLAAVSVKQPPRGPASLERPVQRRGCAPLSAIVGSTSKSTYREPRTCLLPWAEDDCVLKPISLYGASTVSGALLGSSPA